MTKNRIFKVDKVSRYLLLFIQLLLTFPQLICSTADSRKKKYTWSLSSKVLTKSGAKRIRRSILIFIWQILYQSFWKTPFTHVWNTIFTIQLLEIVLLCPKPGQSIVPFRSWCNVFDYQGIGGRKIGNCPGI